MSDGGALARQSESSGSGSKSGADWQIQNWKPMYDRVVALHLAGYKNVNIAAITGYAEAHVSKILNDPRSQKAIKKLQKRLRENFHQRIEDQMLDLGEEAIRNIAETLEADIQAGTKPKKHQDKMSFDLLDRLGHGKKQAESESGSGVKLSDESVDRLANALNKSDEAKRMWEKDEDGEWKEADDEETE